MKIYFKVLLTNQNPIEKQNFLSAIHTHKCMLHGVLALRPCLYTVMNWF